MPRPHPARRRTATSNFRANISASIWSAAAKAVFSFTTRSASRAATRRPMPRQALENYNFFGAPHVAIIHTDEALGIYGAIDCGAYVGNFMLAAQALGLGTIPQAALARHSGMIRRHFGIRRRPPRGVRHLVRLCRPRPQDQQLPHLARERCRDGDVRGGVERLFRHCEEQSSPSVWPLDCFAEPVIGRRSAPTRWLAMTNASIQMASYAGWTRGPSIVKELFQGDGWPGQARP